MTFIPEGLIDLAPDQLDEIRSVLRYISKQPRDTEEIRLYFGDYFVRNAFIRLLRIGYLDKENDKWILSKKGNGGFKLLTD